MLKIDPGMHTSQIARIGVSADGRMIATASHDKTVRLWSLDDNNRSVRLIRTLRVPIGPGNDGKVYAVAFSPNARLVAAAGWDAHYTADRTNFVYVFDAGTGQLLTRLGPLPNAVLDLEFSEDSNRLAAALGENNGIRVWRTGSYEMIFSDPDYAKSTLGLAFARDGRLATACYDGKIRVYSPDLGKPRVAKAPGGERPLGISFSPDGSRLAVGYEDAARVDVIDSNKLNLLFTTKVPNPNAGNLGSVVWTNDGSRLRAGGRYQAGGMQPVLEWNNGGQGAARSLPGSLDTVMDMEPWPGGTAISAADPAFALLNDSGDMIMWRGNGQADLRGKLREHFTVSPDGKRVRFGLKVWGGDPHLLDLNRLTLEASPQDPGGLNQPDTTSLKVTEWEGSTAPKLNGKLLPMKNLETTFSVANLPDRSGLIVGTHFALRRYDAAGNEVWQQQVPGVTWGVNLARGGALIIAAYADGTLRWHRASDGKELLAVYIQMPSQDAPKRLVAWTPKGYYTATPGAEDLIGWHVNRSWDETPDFFPASRFRDRFNRPDIIARVLDDLDEDVAINGANAESKRKREDDILTLLPPVIEIIAPMDGSSTSGAELEIEYLVRSPSKQPVTGVDVLIDGRPLGEGMRGLGRAASVGAQGAVEGEGRFKMKIPAPPRDAEIALVARTTRSTSEARRVRVTRSVGGGDGGGGSAASGGALGLAATAAHEKPKLYALLIGVSEYQNPDLKLNYAGKDARDMEASLKKQTGGLYRDVATKLVADSGATAQAIREGFGWLEKEVTAKDVGLVFLAGHGVTDQQQRFWFLPTDGNTDNLRGTAIAKSDFEEVLRGLPGKALMFIDACHAGKGIERSRYVTRSGGGAVDVTSLVNEMASAENGVVMFASSTGRELSAEDPSWGNGAFTRAVVAGLTGEADYSKDGAITIKELDLWISEHVKELTGGRQHPVSLKPETVPDFPLALAR